MTNELCDAQHIDISKQRLLSLIEFTKESARLKLLPVHDVTKHNIFNIFEHNVLGLPRIYLNKTNEEEIWLTIERMQKLQPPSVINELLAIWIDLSNEPTKEPTLKKSIIIENQPHATSNIIETPEKNEPQIQLLADLEE